YFPQYEAYTVPCKAQPLNIYIYIGNNKYSVKAANYKIEIPPDVCLFAVNPVISGGFSTPWILGTPFIREVCHVYDIENKKIGFAIPRSE
ncbi:unnamed protein product, partial [Strongylus vulgaris]